MTDTSLKRALADLLSEWGEHPSSGDKLFRALPQLGDRHSIVSALRDLQREVSPDDRSKAARLPFMAEEAIKMAGDELWPGSTHPVSVGGSPRDPGLREAMRGDPPTDTGRKAQTHVFKIDRSLGLAAAWEIGLPLIVLGFWIWFLNLVESNKAVEFKGWGLIVTLGFIGWALLALLRRGSTAYQVLSYEVGVSEESIRVRDTTRTWEEISHAEIRPAFGLDPRIVLECSDGQQMLVPAALENIEDVVSLVKTHVTNITDEDA